MPHIIESHDFNQIYKSLIAEVLKNKQEILVKEVPTFETLNQQFILTDIKNYKLDFSSTDAHQRQVNYDRYLSKELEWFKKGSLKAADSPAPMAWGKIADVKGEIQSNYGHLILFKKNDYAIKSVTSYENALFLLRNDIHSRQVLLHYNLPEHYKINAKDVPCTVCAQVFIRENELQFSIFQRSCDLYTGLVYDLPWHCFLLEKMQSDLLDKYPELKKGKITMFIGSLHIYKKNMDFFEKYLRERINKSA